MNLLVALALAAAAPSPLPSEASCAQLWEDTVAAAAPDLDPTDELRKSYLSRERDALLRRCRSADPAVLKCPELASKACSAKFPAPSDGGRALGLATCVWPAVQACVQRERIHAAAQQHGLDALLDELDSGKQAPGKGGLLVLTGPVAELSLKGQALAERHGQGHWVLLVTRQQGNVLEGVVVTSAKAEPLPARGAIQLGALHLELLGALAPRAAEVTAR